MTSENISDCAFLNHHISALCNSSTVSGVEVKRYVLVTTRRTNAVTLIRRMKLEYRLMSIIGSGNVFAVFTDIATSLLCFNFKSSFRMPDVNTASREGGMTNFDSQVDGSDVSQ